jgi:hypothetical protein
VGPRPDTYANLLIRILSQLAIVKLALLVSSSRCVVSYIKFYRASDNGQMESAIINNRAIARIENLLRVLSIK